MDEQKSLIETARAFRDHQRPIRGAADFTEVLDHLMDFTDMLLGIVEQQDANIKALEARLKTERRNDA